ncbi:MAG: hypothetical protein KF809_04590 [Chloroflexi bacterium]|nr:hypothetical protein [Chloroflexota bacterium]
MRLRPAGPRSAGIRRSLLVMAMAAIGATATGAVATAQTPTATPGAPPPQLSVTTTYPSIAVEPGGTATFPLQVTSPVVERVDLTVSGLPEGYGATLRGGGAIVGSVTTTGTSASPALSLEVAVPETATAGSQAFQVQATAASGTASATLDVVVAEGAGGSVTLTGDVPVLQGSTTATFTFNLRLRNDTPESQTFTFTGQGLDAAAAWDVTVQPSGQAQAASVVVDAGSSQNLTATVRPPTDAAAGDYAIVVTATGDQGDTAQLPLGIRLTGSYSFTMVSSDGRLNTSATAGQLTEYQVLITNTGSADLANVALTATPPAGWTVTWDTPAIELIPVGQSATATAQITPASNAIAGDYIVTLTARADQVTAAQTIQLRTTVETSSVWGFVGIALIGLVLVGLFLVFRRYGRR